MAVFIDLLTPGASHQEQPVNPPGTQSNTWNEFHGDTLSSLSRTLGSYYVWANGANAGFNANQGNPTGPPGGNPSGFQFNAITGDSINMAIMPWTLGWFNGLRRTQISNFGLWWLPAGDSSFSAAVVASNSVSNLAPWSGFYQLRAQSTGPGTADVFVDLVQYGQSSYSGINPPTRTPILNCGSITETEWEFGTRGGTYFRLQARDTGTAWELAVWLAQEFYPAAAGIPIAWENRGNVIDSTLDRGQPGWTVAANGTTQLIQVADLNASFEPSPWELSRYL